MNEVRQAGRNPTSKKAEAIQEKRMKLQKAIDEFSRDSTAYIPRAAALPIAEQDISEEWVAVDDDDDDLPNLDVPDTPDHEDIPDTITIDNILPAERQTLLLPSSYPPTVCRGRLRHIAAIELGLREGQANDSLHCLRIAIGQKSFVYRKKIRKGSIKSSYMNRLRSHADAQALRMSIDQSAKVYMSARKAMVSLGASAELLSRYKVLTKEHVAASTAVVDPNAAGQRNKGLSWIWHTHHSASEDPVWLEECAFVFLLYFIC